jgi:hypothetical protein
MLRKYDGRRSKLSSRSPMTTIYRTELRNSSAGATSTTTCRVAELHCTLEADLTGQHCDVMSTAESLVRRLR